MFTVFWFNKQNEFENAAKTFVLYRKQIRIPTQHRWKASRETYSTHTDKFDGYPQNKTYVRVYNTSIWGPWYCTPSIQGNFKDGKMIYGLYSMLRIYSLPHVARSQWWACPQFKDAMIYGFMDLWIVFYVAYILSASCGAELLVSMSSMRRKAVSVSSGRSSSRWSMNSLLSSQCDFFSMHTLQIIKIIKSTSFISLNRYDTLFHICFQKKKTKCRALITIKWRIYLYIWMNKQIWNPSFLQLTVHFYQMFALGPYGGLEGKDGQQRMGWGSGIRDPEKT